MSFYQDSNYPVRSDLANLHATQIDQLANAGAWSSGEQRLAVAGEIRRSFYDNRVQERPVDPGYESQLELTKPAKDLIRELTNEPQGFSENSYDAARSGGLSEEEYVEMVGIIARLTAIDVFARGIGVPLRSLPAAKRGEPSRVRPAAARIEMAWVPTVPNLPEGGEEAKELYGQDYHPYIFRSLSLVPDEMKYHIELENIQYLPKNNILIKDYQHHEDFSRAQAETVAGRVSAINECFY